MYYIEFVEKSSVFYTNIGISNLMSLYQDEYLINDSVIITCQIEI